MRSTIMGCATCSTNQIASVDSDIGERRVCGGLLSCGEFKVQGGGDLRIYAWSGSDEEEKFIVFLRSDF